MVYSIIWCKESHCCTSWSCLDLEAQPKLFAASLADHCVCNYLFCFAQDYTELLAMSTSTWGQEGCVTASCALWVVMSDQLVRKFEYTDIITLAKDTCNPQSFQYTLSRTSTVCMHGNTCDSVCQALKETRCFIHININIYDGNSACNVIFFPHAFFYQKWAGHPFLCCCY